MDYFWSWYCNRAFRITSRWKNIRNYSVFVGFSFIGRIFTNILWCIFDGFFYQQILGLFLVDNMSPNFSIYRINFSEIKKTRNSCFWICCWILLLHFIKLFDFLENKFITFMVIFLQRFDFVYNFRRNFRVWI